jgi:elongation factor Ts
MTITAALVKELRDRTNAGMMECKKALVESNGDIDKAIEAMRKAGQAKAVKKASRTTAEGTIFAKASNDAKWGVLIEINCETDFVAREEKFKHFVKEVGELALQQKISSIEALRQATEQKRLDLVAQLGENVTVRRLAYHDASTGVVGVYAHGDANGVRIGTLVVLKKGTAELARDLAMQVAAMNPEYIHSRDVPEARLLKEKEIFIAQTLEEGKAPAMADKIVAGKVKKFAMEVTLLGQTFVKDSSKTVETLLKEADAEVESFVRFEVGEGIEKQEDNFVQEVMAQVRGGE